MRKYHPKEARPWPRVEPGKHNDKKESEKPPDLLSTHHQEGHGDRGFCTFGQPSHDQLECLLPLLTVIQQAITNLHAYLERKAGEVGALQRRLEGMDGLNHRQLALLRHPQRSTEAGRQRPANPRQGWQAGDLSRAG